MRETPGWFPDLAGPRRAAAAEATGAVGRRVVKAVRPMLTVL